MQLMPAKVENDFRLSPKVHKHFRPTMPMSPLSKTSPPRLGYKLGTRLYRAPQAAIRNHSVVSSRDDVMKGARRRRPSRGISHGSQRQQQQEGMGFALERQSSDRSLGLEEILEPPLWHEQKDPYRRLNGSGRELGGSVPEINWKRTPPGRKLRALHILQGNEDYSEHLEDESFRTYNSFECRSSKEKVASPVKSLWTITNLSQLLLIVMLGGFIFDSRRKGKTHKAQLQQYDEERSHLLDQMMWIDKAAKKVHQRYPVQSPIDLDQETKEQLKQEVRDAQDSLQKLQLRVQLNDRQFLHEKFGDKPLQVGLSLDATGTERISIALSDDTPHAVSIFVQQADKNLWSDLRFERLLSGSIDVFSTQATTTPLLEFLERSRGCHERGAVALRQEEDRDIMFLVLRINLEDQSPLSNTDVCIGRVVKGLDLLTSRVS